MAGADDAAARLARTRLSIIEHVQRKRDPMATRLSSNGTPSLEPQTVQVNASGEVEAASGSTGIPMRRGNGRFSGLTEAGREYWRQHPARMAVELATPALSAYARRRPVRFLAISAGVGALLLLARPWKLISVTGLLLAALRSPQLSSVLMAAVSGVGGGRDDGTATTTNIPPTY